MKIFSPYNLTQIFSMATNNLRQGANSASIQWTDNNKTRDESFVLPNQKDELSRSVETHKNKKLCVVSYYNENSVPILQEVYKKNYATEITANRELPGSTRDVPLAEKCWQQTLYEGSGSLNEKTERSRIEIFIPNFPAALTLSPKDSEHFGGLILEDKIDAPTQIIPMGLPAGTMTDYTPRLVPKNPD